MCRHEWGGGVWWWWWRSVFPRQTDKNVFRSQTQSLVTGARSLCMPCFKYRLATRRQLPIRQRAVLFVILQESIKHTVVNSMSIKRSYIDFLGSLPWKRNVLRCVNLFWSSSGCLLSLYLNIKTAGARLPVKCNQFSSSWLPSWPQNPKNVAFLKKRLRFEILLLLSANNGNDSHVKIMQGIEHRIVLTLGKKQYGIVWAQARCQTWRTAVSCEAKQILHPSVTLWDFWSPVSLETADCTKDTPTAPTLLQTCHCTVSCRLSDYRWKCIGNAENWSKTVV